MTREAFTQFFEAVEYDAPPATIATSRRGYFKLAKLFGFKPLLTRAHRDKRRRHSLRPNGRPKFR